MTTITCSDARAFLLQAGATPMQPVTPIIEHIAGCPACRAYLFLFFQALGVDPGPDIDCNACREDLAACVEEEQVDPQRALRWYPHVWRHLWVCPDCIEAYDLLARMAADPVLQAAPLGPRRRSVSRGAGAIEVIRLLRTALQAALPQRLETARSIYGLSDSYELWERDPAVSAAPLEEGIWVVRVTLSSPQRGAIVARIDDYMLSAALDASGNAHIPIPAGYLTDPDRGDLVLSLIVEDSADL